MYIIKKISDNTLHVWVNKREDDIFKYVPSQINTVESNIEIYLLPDSVCMENCMHGLISKGEEVNGEVVLQVYESINGTEEAPVWNNKLATHPTINIPYEDLYDENNEFVEPAEFIPE